MPTSAPVALIIGSGPRVGDAVSKTLAALGYDIATTARKGTNSRTSDGFFSIKSDVSEPEAVSTVFDAVLAEFGVAPSIVIYNAASMTPPLDEGSLLSVTAQRLTNDLNVNTVSPFIAAQQAVKGWSTLPKGGGLFIYTGNAQDRTILPIPMMLTLGVGKAASSSWIGQADGFYSNNGYRLVNIYTVNFCALLTWFNLDSSMPTSERQKAR